ncbi:MAG: ATP-binding protein [Bacteroidota bacterium]
MVHIKTNKEAADTLIQQARELLSKNLNNAQVLGEEALALARKSLDTSCIVDALIVCARTYARKGGFIKAKKFGEEGLMLADKSKNDLQLARCYRVLGYIYRLIGNAEKALSLYYSALRQDVEEVKSGLYNNISVVYLRLGDYEKSAAFLEKAIAHSLNRGQEDSLSTCYINKGNLIGKSNDFEGAKAAYFEALKWARKLDNHLDATKSLCNIGFVYANLGELDESLKYYAKARKLAEKNGLNYEILHICGGQAYAYFRVKRYKEAIDILLKLYENGKAEEASFVVKFSLEHLQQAYSALKDFEQAYYFQNLLNAYNTKQTKKLLSEKFELIQEEKEAEIQLLKDKQLQIEEQNKALEAMNNELKEFAHIVAHDLKEPLRNISSFVDLLGKKSEGKLSSDLEGLMQHISGNSRQMYTQLSGLVQFVTLEVSHSGTMLVNTSEHVDATLNRVRHDFPKKKVKVRKGTIPDLPIEREHLALLIHHLVQNSIKFCEDPEVIVDIQCSEETHHFQFMVTDNGIGINESYHDRIFKIFNRLDRKHNKGAGIGLAICKKIVQAYGGKIWVRSNPGEGGTFYFTLPKPGI